MYIPLGGSDGFRDIFTEETGPGKMNPETVAGLSYALTDMQTGGKGGLVVIGKDTRQKNGPIENAAVAGARAAGARVIRLGIVPTPLVLYTAQHLGADAAEILTASHNLEEYGGWKGTLGSDKPYGDEVTEIDQRYWDQVDNGLIVPTHTSEEIAISAEFTERYISDVVNDISSVFGEKPLNGKVVVVDGANGAAMYVTPEVFRRLGARVETFACDGSGPINEGCGATDQSGVQEYLRRRPELVADPNFIGVVENDGDADRLFGMGATFDKHGNMIFEELDKTQNFNLDGNRVIELLAEGEEGVVATYYANDGSMKRVIAKGVAYDLCPNSDVEVTHALRELQRQGKNRSRGGEFTGHEVDLNWLSSGDGVRMGAWVAAYANVNGTNFTEIARSMPLWPEKMRKLQVRPDLGETALASVSDALMLTPEEMERGLRFVVRESGTEKDAMRIWGVGRDKDMVNRRTQEIQDLMLPFAA